MKHRLFQMGILAVGTTACNVTSPMPNIIIFLADDLGYNDISCYRESNFPTTQDGLPTRLHDVLPTTRTPAIDALAQDGVRFDDFYAGAAVSSPSRAALLTGRNPARTGIYNWIPAKNGKMHLRPSEITLAEMLSTKGYHTGHFGKWHLTTTGLDKEYTPNDQGFDYAFWTDNAAFPTQHNPRNFYRDRTPVGQMEGYSCDLVVEEAIQWIQEHKDKPFFANVWFNEPHEKVAAPAIYTARHKNYPEYYGAIENMDVWGRKRNVQRWV